MRALQTKDDDVWMNPSDRHEELETLPRLIDDFHVGLVSHKLRQRISQRLGHRR
jgi:hypothetical protein